MQAIITSKRIESFKNQLKKKEIKYSYYNQLQIKSLSKIFQSITGFKELTEKMIGLEKSSPENYSRISSLWITSYFECTKLFSREKYILPIGLKKKHINMFSNFNSLFDLISIEKKLKSLYYTNEIDEVELVGNYEDLSSISEQLKCYDNKRIFEATILSINDLCQDIETYFEAIE